MEEEFKPGEIVICLGLTDSYLVMDSLPEGGVWSKKFAEMFKAGTEVRIIRKLVSGNYFVERFRPPLLRVRLSPTNLTRKEDNSKTFNLAGVEMEGGFRRSDVIITAAHHKKAFKTEVFIQETDPI